MLIPMDAETYDWTYSALLPYGRGHWDRVKEHSEKNGNGVSDRTHKIVIGKLTEFVIADLIQADTIPDITIYTKGTPMTDPDLTKGNLRVHVKAAIYPEDSWVVSATDPIVTSPEECDILYLCYVNHERRMTEVHWKVRATDLVGYWGPTKSLGPDKIALYPTGRLVQGQWVKGLNGNPYVELVV